MDFSKAAKHYKRKIPRFITARTQYRTIDGLRVGMTRAPAKVTIPALIRLTKRFGDLVAAILSHGVPEGREGEDPALSALLDVEWGDPDEVKRYLLLHAIPQIVGGLQEAARDELYWFFEQLLPGSMVLFEPGFAEEHIETRSEPNDEGEIEVEVLEQGEPIPIESMAELDAAGASGATLLACLFFAFEVNFLPTSGALPMLRGSGRQNERPPSEPTAKSSEGQPPATKRKSNSNGGTKRAGQSAPMSTTSG